VLGQADLPGREDGLMLCAVGADGAREEIRSLLESQAYREGTHFLFAA
jgi:hypothetical protein